MYGRCLFTCKQRGVYKTQHCQEMVLEIGQFKQSTITAKLQFYNKVCSRAVARQAVQVKNLLLEQQYQNPLQSLATLPQQYLKGCETDRAPLHVGVLLSGGVDSSVSLALCKAAGHDCRAYYLQIWFKEDFKNFWASCPWEEDLTYAKQVCEMYGVPLEVVPLTNEYWDRVVSHCISEMKKGRTPNPDIWCNSRIKFGAFYDYIANVGMEFDRIVSGHYAQIYRVNDNSVQLGLSTDEIKDQTYFLSGLTQKQLQKVMFPIGALCKPEVRYF
eukprot:TRINITY_DN44566_c0_g1_i1.p1 TRINITY_DN44566_c0_g1~~TRINITY_DN44566_c0_g1_i1.p1  ORF type:complete len:286 (-),score=6.12 TRINITY_DN44566_c0_g1_i1:20-835(-)